MGVLDKLTERIANNSALTALSIQLQATTTISGDLDELTRLTEQLAEEEEKTHEILSALERERQQLIAIFEGVDQPIFVCHAVTHELLYYNDALEKMTNIPATGQKCYQLLYGYTAPCEDCPINREASVESSHTFDRYSEATHKWHHVIHKRIEWPNDPSHPAIFGMLIDITERKDAELAYKSVVENSLQGLVLLTHERVMFCNTAFENLVGLPRDEIYKRPLEEWLTLMPEDERKLAKDHMAKRLAGEKVAQRYMIHLNLEGYMRTFEIFCAATTIKGVRGIQVAVYDVTE